ncbi:hypothetical protein FGO68_gene3079 [Halteria grandinella]|uniref:Transmembrane protein n=1 Tax=Halteria grandinella TaxID=5974 RepID=A0A8J8SYK5_HALGN|nr:hypothetical protein FGO68_gene3079 [Halteria grandinella]
MDNIVDKFKRRYRFTQFVKLFAIPLCLVALLTSLYFVYSISKSKETFPLMPLLIFSAPPFFALAWLLLASFSSKCLHRLYKFRLTTFLCGMWLALGYYSVATLWEKMDNDVVEVVVYHVMCITYAASALAFTIYYGTFPAKLAILALQNELCMQLIQSEEIQKELNEIIQLEELHGAPQQSHYIN